MKLKVVQVYLKDYETLDAQTHELRVITDDAKRFVDDEKARHGSNFAGFSVEGDAPLALYGNTSLGVTNG